MHLRVINGGLSQNPGKAKTISPKKNSPRHLHRGHTGYAGSDKRHPRSELLNKLIENIKTVYYSDYEDLKIKVYGAIGASADEVERRRLNHEKK